MSSRLLTASIAFNKCPYWVVGRHQGKRYHQSLRTADSKTAAKLVEQLLLTGKLGPTAESNRGIKIADAVDRFIAEQRMRGVGNATIRSYVQLFTGAPGRRSNGRFRDQSSPTLLEFAKSAGIEYLRECDVDFLTRFRQSLSISRRTLSSQTGKLRTLFHFAKAQKWIDDDPSPFLKMPIGGNESMPAIPFTREQVRTIVDACGENEYLKMFCLVMRYSGLATVDAIKLTPDLLDGDSLKLRRTKTGGWVKVLLPRVIADRLRALPTYPCGYWFWNKHKAPTHEIAGNEMRRALRPVFRLVPLKDEEGHPVVDRLGAQKYGHPYQFRHTFVREQLEAGATLKRIAELLGNTYQIVEKHYSAWVPSRQAILDDLVKKSWDEGELAGY
jgi:site-specific recombinase XerD